MAHFPPAASGTDSAVPVAAHPPSGDANAVAAFLSAALANLQGKLLSLQSGVAPQAAVPPTPHQSAPASAALVAPIALPTTPGFRTSGPWIARSLYVVVPTAPLLAIDVPDSAPREDTKWWYCITKGTYIGVTLSHALAVNAVSGVSCSAMKAYPTQAQAIVSFNELLGYNLVVVIA
ncbi:hypothetical protein B0H16DRAFT_1737893 [Mycena metata]|uniref:Uncharacterized protein n=1 Tax=Mycena metata TaxID=1033252 RepID=A0AAD7MLV1_9AGAR|nr:hypothetical protein B0H16DRAFT_1737893 [Mycena metata]